MFRSSIAQSSVLVTVLVTALVMALATVSRSVLATAPATVPRSVLVTAPEFRCENVGHRYSRDSTGPSPARSLIRDRRRRAAPSNVSASSMIVAKPQGSLV